MFEWLESLAIHAAEAKAAADARIPGDHPFLTDHFPGHPLLPGSLQLELCAQVAGPLVEELVAAATAPSASRFSAWCETRSSMRRSRFPATLGIFMRATRVERDIAVVQGDLTHAIDAVDCRVELVMVMRPPEPGWEDAIRVYRARIAALKARARP